MRTAFAPVIPHSIERAKRIAKTLQDIYPSHSLSHVQGVTARLFGHADWHALHKAVEGRLPSAPFDEDMPEDEGIDRLIMQGLIVCRELGGYDPTKGDVEEALGGVSPAADLAPDFQLRKARGTFEDTLSAEVIHEVRPTAKKLLGKVTLEEDIFCVCPMDELEKLPAYLGQWWTVNIRHQPEVATALETYKLNPRSRVELMRFGAYWAELSTYHALNATMVIGPAYLLAEHFSAIRIRATAEFVAYLDALIDNSGEPLPDHRMQLLLKPVVQHFTAEVEAFFASYLRRDLLDIYKGRPVVFQNAAERCLEMFGVPKAGRGGQKR